MYEYEEVDLDVPCRDRRLRGTMFLPKDIDRPPLIIASHGLSSTRGEFTPYAEALCRLGFALYCFDFRGGSSESESGGDTMHMSVLTELDDLNTVVSAARTWDNINPARIILLGASQGGLVSALCAARRPEDIAGLILLFPALSIPEMVHVEFPVRESIPDEYLAAGSVPVSRMFAEDIYNIDPYAEMPAYKGPVLLLHGDADTLVPLVFSQRAAQAYPDAKLEIVPGGMHGFSGEALDMAMENIEVYLEKFQPRDATD